MNMIDLADILGEIGCPDSVTEDSRCAEQREGRKRLRDRFPPGVGKGNRWEWLEDDPNLSTVRALLSGLCQGK